MQDRVRAVFPDARPLSIGEVLRSPGILKEPDSATRALAEPAKACFTRALAALQAARRREGERIVERCVNGSRGSRSLRTRSGRCSQVLKARYRESLQERLQRFDVQVQPERIEQELAILAQRVDVAEEVDRLVGHIAEIGDVLRRAEPVGRRLDFLIQELNREANTLASKVQDEFLTRAAVELKVLDRADARASPEPRVTMQRREEAAESARVVFG